MSPTPKRPASEPAAGDPQAATPQQQQEQQPSVAQTQEQDRAGAQSEQAQQDQESARTTGGPLAPSESSVGAPEATEEQLQGPEQPLYRPVGVLDTRVRVQPKDRNTFIGVVHRRDRDTDIPDGYLQLDALPEDREEVDGDEVEHLQVIGGSGGTVIRLNGQAFNLGPLAAGLAKDLQQAGLVNANS